MNYRNKNEGLHNKKQRIRFRGLCSFIAASLTASSFTTLTLYRYTGWAKK